MLKNNLLFLFFQHTFTKRAHSSAHILQHTSSSAPKQLILLHTFLQHTSSSAHILQHTLDSITTIDQPLAVQWQNARQSAAMPDAVVRECSLILQDVTRLDQNKKAIDNVAVVGDLHLDIFDEVGGVDIKSKSCAMKFDEDLHGTGKNQVQCGLPLDVVGRDHAAILQRMLGKKQMLLMQGKVFYLLNLQLHFFYSVTGQDF